MTDFARMDTNSLRKLFIKESKRFSFALGLNYPTEKLEELREHLKLISEELQKRHAPRPSGDPSGNSAS